MVIVNETRRGSSGMATRSANESTMREVVGVVRDSKYWTIGEIVRPLVYTAYLQRPESEVTVFVRTSDIVGHGESAARRDQPGWIPTEVRRRPGR